MVGQMGNSRVEGRRKLGRLEEDVQLLQQWQRLPASMRRFWSEKNHSDSLDLSPNNVSRKKRSIVFIIYCLRKNS